MTDLMTAMVLAAGKGTRMKSDLAKVLFPLEGRALVHHVLDAVEGAGFDRAVAIVGHQHERVREALKNRRVEFVLQEQQLGTGHAVSRAAPLLEGYEGDVAVLAGDAPLIRAATLRELMGHHRRRDAVVTVLTAVLPDAADALHRTRVGLALALADLARLRYRMLTELGASI